MNIEAQERTRFAELPIAPKGTSVTYHIGLLGKDRENSKEIDAAATLAWSMHKAGIAALVQRRISPGVCQYIATRL
jgi:hypothetical protein